jgi:hypothetical protein
VSERCQHCGAALTKLSDRIEALQAQLKDILECQRYLRVSPRTFGGTNEVEMIASLDGEWMKVKDMLAVAQEVGNSSKKQNLGFRNTVGGMLKDNDTGKVSEPTTTDLSDFPEDLK